MDNFRDKEAPSRRARSQWLGSSGSVEGVVAFLAFALASTAMVSATLLALYGTAASGVYMLAR